MSENPNTDLNTDINLKLYQCLLDLITSEINCPVCGVKPSSIEIVYTQCCFQMICETCDKKCQNCIGCGSKLGDLIILFGSLPGFVKSSSKLRLLPNKNTAKSIILSIKTQYSPSESQLTNRLTLHKLNSIGDWNLCTEDDKISTNEQYYLSPMRLPHRNVTNEEIDKWIVTMLMSEDRFTKNKLTEEELHRKCIIYAMRLYPLVFSHDFIRSRL
jgi:hypothetical protein